MNRRGFFGTLAAVALLPFAKLRPCRHLQWDRIAYCCASCGRTRQAIYHEMIVGVAKQIANHESPKRVFLYGGDELEWLRADQVRGSNKVVVHALIGGEVFGHVVQV